MSSPLSTSGEVGKGELLPFLPEAKSCNRQRTERSNLVGYNPTGNAFSAVGGSFVEFAQFVQIVGEVQYWRRIRFREWFVHHIFLRVAVEMVVLASTQTVPVRGDIILHKFSQNNNIHLRIKA